MKIAVLSGKGGTGKTFVSVNLAAIAGQAVYVDCDVEEPNGRLFLKPVHVCNETVYKLLPAFDGEKCVGCRKCVEFCRFNALAFVGEKPLLFSDVCHSCGGCALLCPAQAVGEMKAPIGVVEYGMRGAVTVVTGILNVGEASGTRVIEAALKKASDFSSDLTVIDCPPGSSCAVMESIRTADYCLLVAEPTAFGLHDFTMVHELVTLLGKPCGVVINKDEAAYMPLERFCATACIPILCRIPYRAKLARLGALAQLAAVSDEESRRLFQQLLAFLRGEVVA